MAVTPISRATSASPGSRSTADKSSDIETSSSPPVSASPAIATPATAESAMSLRHHVGQTIRLGLPVMLSRAGLVIMIAVDTFLCRNSKLELAFFGGSVQPQPARAVDIAHPQRPLAIENVRVTVGHRHQLFIQAHAVAPRSSSW